MLNASSTSDFETLNGWLLKITSIFWLLAKSIGWRMFTACRTFPTAPVFDIFDQVPQPVHVILFAAGMLLMGMLLVRNRNKALLWGLLLIELFSCILDQNCWQPWEYQYLFFVFIFIINDSHQKLLTLGLSFILISTYIYSGLGKLNEGFLNTIWTKMFLELFFKIPAPVALKHWVHYSGYLVGMTELIAGMGLLFAKTRRVAACILILMHLFILVLLGPYGLRYNKIVWPWNLAMMLYLYIVFLRNPQVQLPYKSIIAGWNKLVFICWGILPALNFAGYWDNYLSSGIYSGKLPRMLICIKDTSKCRELQRFCKQDTRNICGGGLIIDLQYWAMTETNAAPYPEIRVHKMMATKLQKQYPGAGLSCFYLESGLEKRLLSP